MSKVEGKFTIPRSHPLRCKPAHEGAVTAAGFRWDSKKRSMTGSHEDRYF